MPPTTLMLFFKIIIDSWLRSNTSLTIYSLGILGSCLAKMFLRSKRYFKFSWFWSLRITLKVIVCCSSCSFAAVSLATKPRPTFYIENKVYLAMHAHKVVRFILLLFHLTLTKYKEVRLRTSIYCKKLRKRRSIGNFKPTFLTL